MRTHPSLTSGVALAVAVSALLSSSLQAQTAYTGAGLDTLFTNADNWDNGVPDNAGNSGTVGSGFTVTTALATDLNNATVTWTGTALLDGGGTAMRFGDATYTFEGSSAVTAGNAFLGRGGASDVGTVNWDSTGTFSADNLTVGRDAAGFFNQSTGNVSLSGALNIGRGSVPGVYTLSGGTVSVGSLNLITGVGVFDFGTANSGMLTIVGSDFTADFDTLITAGDITALGATAVPSNFSNLFDGSNTVLTLVPEPSAFSLLAGFLAIGAMMIRRRK